MKSMAEGCYDQACRVDDQAILVDVEVTVRPITGYFAFPALTSTTLQDDQNPRKTDSNTQKTTSAVSVATSQEVVYKTGNTPPQLNCLWKADSSESYFKKKPPTRPKQTTSPRNPEPVSKKGWTKALGSTHKSKKSTGGWHKALSSKQTSPTVSRLSMASRGSTTASSSKDCRCRCRRRKRKERNDKKIKEEESKSKETSKKPEKEEKKPEPKKTFFRSPMAAALKDTSEVIVEPAPYPPEEKVPYYILWEIKAWAVLLLFWLILFVYRYYAAF